MQLPEDFWAFSCELTNFHYFRQKINASFTRQYHQCHINLVIMLLQTVTEVLLFIDLLPNVIEECNRLLPDGAADSKKDAWDSARIARVSQQYLHENCTQMIEKGQMPPNNSLNLNAVEISCPGNDARSCSETFIRRSEHVMSHWRYWTIFAAPKLS